MAQQHYEDEDSGIFMSPDSTTKRSTFSDKDLDDHDQAAAARRRLFEEQQQRDNRMQQALTAARKRMESGRTAIEQMMLEERVRTQKMASLEAEAERLRSMLSQRDMAIAMLTQTVIKERERFRNERALLQHTTAFSMDTEAEATETLYVDESLSVGSRKRKRGMPTPPSSDITGMLWDKGSAP
ncbi:hypothetical protein PG994_000586 [Apiospora phragmitis]|uniref:Uncharacterized protein n=1 Tax=Apiospora phragmitis TaxID=2905665 RepID=A0ABR1X6T4_9PEZI